MRSRARELALQVLFQSEFSQSQIPQILEERDQASLAYAEVLIQGVTQQLPDLDKLITKYSHNWKMDRMALVDKNILRIGIYELMHNQQVSVATVIDEAVELAKKFSQTDSPGFVNAILDQVAKHERRS